MRQIDVNNARWSFIIIRKGIVNTRILKGTNQQAMQMVNERGDLILLLVYFMAESDLHRQARIHRERAELFAQYASMAKFPETRQMYERLAIRESALADQFERQAAKSNGDDGGSGSHD